MTVQPFSVGDKVRCRPATFTATDYQGRAWEETTVT